jgi:hypothetical protein
MLRVEIKKANVYAASAGAILSGFSKAAATQWSGTR